MPSEPLPLSFDDEDAPATRRTRKREAASNKRWQIVAVVGLFAALLTLGGIFLTIRGCSKKEEGTSSTSGGSFTVVRIDAEDLFADYKANQVAADGKYKTKELEVTGVVDSIKKTSEDVPFVAFRRQLNSGRTTFPCCRAYFPKQAASQLTPLSRGQRITVRGKCIGIESVKQGIIEIDVVSLEDCKLLR